MQSVRAPKRPQNTWVSPVYYRAMTEFPKTKKSPRDHSQGVVLFFLVIVRRFNLDWFFLDLRQTAKAGQHAQEECDS